MQAYPRYNGNISHTKDSKENIHALEETLSGGQRDTGREEGGINEKAYETLERWKEEGATDTEAQRLTEKKVWERMDRRREEMEEGKRPSVQEAEAEYKNALEESDVQKAKAIANGIFAAWDISDAAENREGILKLAELFSERDSTDYAEGKK